MICDESRAVDTSQCDRLPIGACVKRWVPSVFVVDYDYPRFEHEKPRDYQHRTVGGRGEIARMRSARAR